MMTATEIHSSDMTASCLRSVQLRHEGKIVGGMPTAMLRGQLAGEVLRRLHESSLAHDAVADIVQATLPDVLAQAAGEGMAATNGAENYIDDTVRDVTRACEAYCHRFGSMFEQCTIIGCEVPIRFSFECDGEQVQFASHLDLLFRDWNGEYVFWDWKWRMDSPTIDYLFRNMQFASYAYGIRHGSVMVDPMTETWNSLAQWPRAAWVHLPSLLPYGKAMTGTDDAGQERQFKKGDPRPMKSIVKAVAYSDASEAGILDELRLRWRMRKAGLYPTNPDPVGCFTCASRSFCPSFNGGNQ